MLERGMHRSLVSLFILSLVLVGCGQRMSKVRTPKDIPQIEPFKNSPVQVFESEMAEMGTTTRGILLPTVGEELAYEAGYSITKSLKFTIKQGTTDFSCSFKFEKAKIIEKVTKVDAKSYEINKTTIPIGPTYVGTPISDWEAKCVKSLSEGSFNRDYVFLIKDQFENFKTFVRKNFVNVYNNCKGRVRPLFLTCKDNGIDIDKVVDEHVDFYQMLFAGSLKGKPLKLKVSLNFEKIYFTNFGVLEMELIGTTSIGLSKINSIKTLNWKL